MYKETPRDPGGGLRRSQDERKGQEWRGSREVSLAEEQRRVAWGLFRGELHCLRMEQSVTYLYKYFAQYYEVPHGKLRYCTYMHLVRYYMGCRVEYGILRLPGAEGGCEK